MMLQLHANIIIELTIVVFDVDGCCGNHADSYTLRVTHNDESTDVTLDCLECNIIVSQSELHGDGIVGIWASFKCHHFVE